MGAMRQQFLDRTSVFDCDAALAAHLEVCGMIGRFPAMRELFRVSSRPAPSVRTVLITGETGTGRELVARALHTLGPPSAKRVFTVNCSAAAVTAPRTCLNISDLNNVSTPVPVVVADDEPGPPPDAGAVAAALDSAGGNQSLAARCLGISRRARYRLIGKYAAKPGGA